MAPQNLPYAIPHAYLGVSLLFTWTYSVLIAGFNGSIHLPISQNFESGYALSALIMVVSIVAVALTSEKVRKTLLMAFWMKIVIALGLSVSTILIFLARGLPFYLGTASSGLFSGLLALQWISAFRHIGLKNAVEFFPSLLAVSICICVTLTWFPSEVGQAVICMLPVVSECLFHLAKEKPIPEYDFHDSRISGSNRRVAYGIAFFLSSFLGITIGFFDSSAESQMYSPLFYGIITVIILASAGIYIFVENRDRLIAKYAMPIGVIFVALVPFFSQNAFQLSDQVISLGNLHLEALIFIASVGFAEIINVNPIRIYALVRATFTCIGFLSNKIVTHVSFLLENPLLSAQISFTVIGVAIFCLIASLMLLYHFFRSKESACAEREPNAQDSKMMPTSETEEPAILPRCLEIAEQFNLSKRETEIFVLLAKGYSSSGIQKKLYIAPGTVRYHSHNIYTKLGIHSRQEIIDLAND